MFYSVFLPQFFRRHAVYIYSSVQQTLLQLGFSYMSENECEYLPNADDSVIRDLRKA
jgi:hypothetical protein